MSRISLRLSAQTGTGMQTVGKLLSRGLRSLGFWVVADREYPSIIMGINHGHACLTLNFSAEKICGLEDSVDLLMATDKQSMSPYWPRLKDKGVFVHGHERLFLLRKGLLGLQEREVSIIAVKARQLAREQGGSYRHQNIILCALVWKCLGLPWETLAAEIKSLFERKGKAVVDLNLQCGRLGYETEIPELSLTQKVAQERAKISAENSTAEHILIDGHHALALGAIAAGVKAYFAYPMSPSSGILFHLSKYAKEAQMLVKQGEDEITVAQLTLGASHSGLRTFCATSGGGFDLMTETFSLAGMIEVPLVVVVAQRPGPATGLPTWTGQGDLNLAIYSGHGDYPRAVLAATDPEDTFIKIQEALNLAEQFQIPVVLLTEKNVGETIMTIPKFSAEKYLPIKRGLVTDPQALEQLESTDRYQLSDTGLGKRWLPGSGGPVYFANGDEHDEKGVLNEEGPLAKQMAQRREKKYRTLLDALPEPELRGDPEAELTIVGWGSTGAVMHDALIVWKSEGLRINYLHYSHLWPLRTERLRALLGQGKKCFLIEGNLTGQLGTLLEGSLQREIFMDKYLKYDGRSFMVSEIVEKGREWVKTHSKES